MKIYLHHLKASVAITDSDFPQLAELLSVPLSYFKESVGKNGTKYMTYSDGSELVRCTIPSTGIFGSLTIHGKHFDNNPELPTHRIWRFIRERHGNCLELDISFEDDNNVLDFAEIRRMSLKENYLEYIMGTSIQSRKKYTTDEPHSNNRSGAPDVHLNHPLIHFGDRKSPTCAKAYVRANGNVKVELTLSDKVKANSLLDAYNPDSFDMFLHMSKAA